MAGVLTPRAGTIRFEGRDVTRLPAWERARLGIALVPEGRRVFPFLTVRENLEMGGFKFRGDPARVRALMDRMLAMFPRLEERVAQAAGTLSGGEQQMLALARAMMSEPRLLCLDEPSLGLAPMMVQEIFHTIRGINAKGISILLVEQNAFYALETATRGYVLQTGAIIAVQAVDRGASSLADLARGVDQVAVRLEVARVAARARRRDREVEREDPDDHQREPSMTGLQSNSDTEIEFPELSMTSEALGWEWSDQSLAGRISLEPAPLLSVDRVGQSKDPFEIRCLGDPQSPCCGVPSRLC